MSEWLPQLLRPYWLLILPLLIWLLWRLWHRQLQVGRWQRLLPATFHAALLTRGRLRQSRLPWIVLGLAWLLAVGALFGPSWQRYEQPSIKRSDPLVVLLELTPSMLASDAAPTRLAQAKRELLDLLERRQDRRSRCTRLGTAYCRSNAPGIAPARLSFAEKPSSYTHPIPTPWRPPS